MQFNMNKNETEIIEIKSEIDEKSNKFLKKGKAMQIYRHSIESLGSLEAVVKVLLIHVGGTFGMLKSSEGYTTVPGQLYERIRSNERLNMKYADRDAPPVYKKEASAQLDAVSYDYLEFSSIKDSTEAVGDDIVSIVETIKDEYKNYDGFVVLHGTDTMTYVGSAVSYMIRNLKKPIIFTGSMVPMCEENSDAVDNLVNVFDWIIDNRDISGVFLVFEKLRALMTRAYKFSSEGKDSFHSIAPQIVETSWRKPYFEKEAEFVLGIASNVLVFKLTPFSEIVEVFLRKALDSKCGIVIESYGNGNIPKSYVNIIKEYQDVPVVIVSQCRLGTMNGDYLCGKRLQECANVIMCNNVTSEAAASGLAVFLTEVKSGESTVKKVREMFESYKYNSLTDSGYFSCESN
ncbi:60kDa lysophospholipase [Pancytospora epiphaga]|nr:60kDa lysophospholipase [Pancytospora epiphaga]